jgi:branched-subunit amino acid transport protein
VSGLWWLVVGMGAITFALRLLPILFSDRADLPPILRRGLRMVPAAVLSALIVPDLLLRDGQVVVSAANPRLLAGLLAALVAWRTKNIALTLIAGMVALWLAAAVLA